MRNYLRSPRLLPLLPLSLTFILVAPQLHAKVIGMNVVAPSLTVERIEKLAPKKDRAAWLAYLKRSEEQMKVDKATLAAELKPGEVAPPQPAEGRGFGQGISLRHPDDYYSTAPARHIADVVVSFQTPGGGWSKNMGFAGALRLPGQPYAANNLNVVNIQPNDFDTPKDPKWNYVSTLDNDATNTELHFLAKVQVSLPGKDGDAYRASFIKGIHYLLNAQFPNGGFPQVWPLEGGYHDAITFNDNAVSESAETLSDVAEAKPGYDFVPAELRKQAAAAVDRALQCILVSQTVIDGKRTIWPQQEDALTLAPVSARNYEPGALAASESADLLEYLMSLPNPSKELVASIQAGVTWLKDHEIFGFEYTGGRGDANGRTLKPKEGAGPIWSRYYSIPAQKPIFGDRDETLHDDVNDLSMERRNGYAWYSNGEQKTVDDYAAWAKANAVK